MNWLNAFADAYAITRLQHLNKNDGNKHTHNNKKLEHNKLNFYFVLFTCNHLSRGNQIVKVLFYVLNILFFPVRVKSVHNARFTTIKINEKKHKFKFDF